MLGLIDFIDIFSSSEWIDIVTGILIPTLIIRHSSKSAKKQFKEQTRIAEEQLETQNLLSIKKEKRMLFTKLKLSKYESLHVALTEYMNLYYISYDNTYDCLVGLKTYNQYLDEHMASRENLAKKRDTVISLLSYCPELKHYWDSMFQQEKKFDALFLKLKDYPVGDNPDNISNSYKYFFNKIESRYANYVSLSNSLRKEIEKETLSILKELEE